jgi:hypothetical protein
MDYSNLISKESTIEPEVGRIMNLSKINKIFFGNSEEFCLMSKIELLNSNMIIKKNNEFFMLTNEILKYFDMVKDKIDINKFIPYNYFTLIKKDNIPEHFNFIINSIHEYIKFLDQKITKNELDIFSTTIKNIIIKNNMFRGELVDCIPFNYIVKFDKIGKPLMINFTYEEDSINSLILDKTNTNDNMEKLYQYHKNHLLLESPRDFLISNLERVTGDINFSKMAVESYLMKNQFETHIDGLTNLILWKNGDAKLSYLTFFVQKYNHLIKGSKDGLMTNFEGFNKFLLNLEVNYLQQWEVKEQYNELYYQITHELIKSYEILYMNK